MVSKKNNNSNDNNNNNGNRKQWMYQSTDSDIPDSPTTNMRNNNNNNTNSNSDDSEDSGNISYDFDLLSDVEQPSLLSRLFSFIQGVFFSVVNYYKELLNLERLPKVGKDYYSGIFFCGKWNCLLA